MFEINAEKFINLLAKEGINPKKLQDLVVRRLSELSKTVATAESCTGGLISKRITEVSGASNVFECGVCSYSNGIKRRLLGVKGETLAAVGAVSPAVAAQMAEGVRELSNADFGLSTTGIAGPTGGTKEKPVGLVYIALSYGGATEIVKASLSDVKPLDRENVRREASDIALWLLLNKIR